MTNAAFTAIQASAATRGQYIVAAMAHDSTASHEVVLVLLYNDTTDRYQLATAAKAHSVIGAASVAYTDIQPTMRPGTTGEQARLDFCHYATTANLHRARTGTRA